MKSAILLLVVSLLILLSTQTLFGQTETPKKLKFGLGVSIFNLAEQVDIENYQPMNSVYLTFDINRELRIEPSIGFVLVEEESRYNVGVGVFGIKSFSKINMLYGIRIGAQRIENYARSSSNFSDNNLFLLSPTIGAEYLLIDRFSLGAEVQLRGIFYDKEIVVTTLSSMFVRFYFNRK